MIAELALPEAALPRLTLANTLRALLTGLLTMVARARQRRALADLDARLLDDIGLTRADAARETRKPFWNA